MYKIIEVSKYIMPFGYGICLPFGILLVRKDSQDLAYIKAHEVGHYMQVQEEGSYLKWLFKYLKENLTKGYRNNRYEVNAINYGIANRDKFK